MVITSKSLKSIRTIFFTCLTMDTEMYTYMTLFYKFTCRIYYSKQIIFSTLPWDFLSNIQRYDIIKQWLIHLFVRHNLKPRMMDLRENANCFSTSIEILILSRCEIMELKLDWNSLWEFMINPKIRFVHKLLNILRHTKIEKYHYWQRGKVTTFSGTHNSPQQNKINWVKYKTARIRYQITYNVVKGA